MSEHFVGKYEVEYKYRVESHQSVLATLQALGASVFVEQNRERDIYFERGDKELAQQGVSMSVRVMKPSGIKLWIVKGPGNDRCEAVNVESVSKTCSMLETLGYHPAFTIEKSRSIYFLEQFHVTLDVVSELGCFVEIAVMTDEAELLEPLKEQCLQLSEKLGLGSDALEVNSYRALLGHI